MRLLIAACGVKSVCLLNPVWPSVEAQKPAGQVQAKQRRQHSLETKSRTRRGQTCNHSLWAAVGLRALRGLWSKTFSESVSAVNEGRTWKWKIYVLKIKKIYDTELKSFWGLTIGVPQIYEGPAACAFSTTSLCRRNKEIWALRGQ